MMRRGWAVGACLLGVLSSATSLRAEGPCTYPEDPDTCGEYRILEGSHRWRTAADGVATIEYYINPTQPWMAERDAIDATVAAFQVWEDWNPSVTFRYLGTTLRPPAPQDGLNVVGWLPFYGRAGAVMQAEEGWSDLSGQRSGYIGEVDIILNSTHQWKWDGCEQADGSCADRGSRHPILGLVESDVQSIVTHEVGHLLGLDHVPGPATQVVTMTASTSGSTSRHLSTLALGDVLGAKFLYPWTCPPAGAPIPARYSRVCPTIQIFSP